jgi:Mg2+ and Co2+ transporter CorA
MDENLSCQLYRYDQEFFLVTRNTPEFFATEFIEIARDESQVTWLNYHSLANREPIEKLCEHLHIERLSVEDIYTEKKRPKLEEYANYMFFSCVRPYLLKTIFLCCSKSKSPSFLAKIT